MRRRLISDGRSNIIIAAVAVVLFVSSAFLAATFGSGSDTDSTTRRLTRIARRRDVTVFTTETRTSSRPFLVGDSVQRMNPQQQRDFVQKNAATCYSESSSSVMEQYQTLPDHLRVELYKFCALYAHGGVYLDEDSPLLASVHDLVGDYNKMAVIGSSFMDRTIHGSLLMLPAKSTIAEKLIRLILETPNRVLEASPLLLPQKLYDLIAQELQTRQLKPSQHDEWMLLEQRCHVDPFKSQEPFVEIQARSLESNKAQETYRLTYHCPIRGGYCCDVYDPVEDMVVLMTPHPLLPYQVLPPSSDLPKPYSYTPDFEESQLPFIATVKEKTKPRRDKRLTPNFYEILFENECLPTSKLCASCLRQKTGATCKTCRKICPCYCKALCNTKVPEKHVSKEIFVRPPLYSRDPSRLIPRIVHQTWFEEVDPEKYPNMSRLMESWKRSGWEYRFFTDAEAAEFLSMHFPPEVREAYDSITPGAFKADLFRYCALFINGGVYADMDVLLETNLDEAVAPVVGFMTPVDEPGKPVDHRMCLWNGFIASAPGHPFLAKVIETVVNNIRNRFTSVDYDHMFCPDPELSVLHAFDTLLSAGPCILGYSINMVLDRPPQQQFEAGDLVSEGGIPGRSIILHQNKWDMGAHRFTWLEKNLVVAATDMPDYDDRKTLEGDKKKEHYSKVHVKEGLYGVKMLYTDNESANEEIRIRVKNAA